MTPEVRLSKKEKAVINVIYTRTYSDRTLHKYTATHGYKKQYFVTVLKQYFDTKQDAEKARDKFNEQQYQKKRAKAHEFPDILDWYMFTGTELHNPLLWWHNSGSWLYAHGYDEWETEELFEDIFTYEYEDMHSTKDFFEVLFKTPLYIRYYVSKNNKDKQWKLYEKI